MRFDGIKWMVQVHCKQLLHLSRCFTAAAARTLRMPSVHAYLQPPFALRIFAARHRETIGHHDQPRSIKAELAVFGVG